MAKFNFDFDSTIYLITKYAIRILIFAMTVALLFTLVQLLISLGSMIINPPHPYSLDVLQFFTVLKLSLIIVVGYELIKSMLYIINSDSIPVTPIINIAIIAMANKIITLDFHDLDAGTIAGIALIMIGLGLTRFFIAPREKEFEHK